MKNIYALAASPNFSHDHTIFAGSEGGLYRSVDAGQSWQFVYASLELSEPLPTTAIALSPDFATDKTLFAGVSGGVLRSTDRGDTWQVALFPPPAPTISALVVSPDFQRDGVILAGTVEDGMWRSADRGTRWSPWNFGLLDLNIISAAISPAYEQDQTIFVGTESGLFRSTNGGRAWRAIDLPGGFDAVLSLAFIPNGAEPGGVLVGTQTNGLLRLDDKAKVWQRPGQEHIQRSVNAVVLSQPLTGPLHILAVLDGAALISYDAGHSWSEWGNIAQAGHLLSVVAAPCGLTPLAPLFVGSMGGGVLISN